MIKLTNSIVIVIVAYINVPRALKTSRALSYLLFPEGGHAAPCASVLAR